MDLAGKCFLMVLIILSSACWGALVMLFIEKTRDTLLFIVLAPFPIVIFALSVLGIF